MFKYHTILKATWTIVNKFNNEEDVPHLQQNTIKITISDDVVVAKIGCTNAYGSYFPIAEGGGLISELPAKTQAFLYMLGEGEHYF